MSYLLLQLEHYRLILPVISSILLILALPPFNFSYIVWCALIFIYLFIRLTTSKTELFLGAIFFSIFYSGYITYSVLSGLSWIEEAQLFSWFMDGIGFTIVGFTTLTFILWFQFLNTTKSYKYFSALAAALSFTALEHFLTVLYFNFNYGALSYTMVSNSFFLTLGTSYGLWIITFIIVWVNFSMCDIFWHRCRKEPIIPSLIIFALGLVVLAALWLLTTSLNTDITRTEHVTLAIIQDTDRNPKTTFGTINEGKFTFPALEAWLETAQNEAVDMIIYPFNPWSGVLGDIDYNSQFDRSIIAVNKQQFSNWLLEHLLDDTIFVTWYTTYDGNDFFNEIVYWQSGEIIHKYQKQKLFPFFDYTPQWAAHIGMYSTPIDATVGPSAAPFIFNSTLIGNVICSELADDSIMKSAAATSNLILAIGSEAMFTSSIPSEFNYLNAQYYAARNNTPVVRATKLGPSGVFASDGSTIASLPYNESGLIIATIPIDIEF